MLTGQTALRTCVLLISVPFTLEKIQLRYLTTKNYVIPVSAVNVDNEFQKTLLSNFKLKSSEQYYMTLLQIYMPKWDEDNLKGTYRTFDEKYLAVEFTLKPNILKHNNYFETLDSNDDILDNHYDYSSSNDISDDDNDYENECSMLNRDLIDFDSRDEDDRAIDKPIGPIASASVPNASLPREVFYEMYSQLNECQQNLFNFIMKYAIKYMLNERIDLDIPDPFDIFLSEGAGAGKCFQLI